MRPPTTCRQKPAAGPGRGDYAPRISPSLNKGNVRRVFVRRLKRTELPLHFSPHCLRHTFTSLLLQQGESPVYVQRQLGYTSIKLTVDTNTAPGQGRCGGRAREVW